MISTSYLTIKELTQKVGGGLTPRMVRYYHQIGLIPPAQRSPGNYRLYTEADVRRLQQIVALKQQGFQLEHIRQLLDSHPDSLTTEGLTGQLQQHYRVVVQHLVKLRQTASALERILGRDRFCQKLQAEALAQLRQMAGDTQPFESAQLEQLWDTLDAAVPSHPEAFNESLHHLLPDLSARSEIEVDLLSKLVLACGDISLVEFVHISQDAIASARETLKSGCQVVGDVPAIVAAFDQVRLAHLGCGIMPLIDNPHITSAADAEAEFWYHPSWQDRLQQLTPECILVIGYAPSVLMTVCEAIKHQIVQPALIIGMPIGFSHAPAAKRRLKLSGIPFITTEGTIGGGLLAAVALNALVESLIEKPNCHCYLSQAS